MFPVRFAATLVLLSRLPFPGFSEEERADELLHPPGWKLTFVDEFDSDRLDYDLWTPKDPWEVVRNDELQGYWIKAFETKNGVLSITAENKPSFYDGARRDYRSGMMSTTGKFSQKYGRFEIRCRIPAGKGLWPAFWMLPEPPSWPPEIDVLEILGGEPDRLYMSNHWSDPKNPGGDSKAQTGEFKGPDFSREFHTFAVEWEKGLIRWLVDGVVRHESRNEVPDVPMFLLVNLAIGGWAKEPDDQTRFPAKFEIDYIKAWEKQEK